MSMRTAAGRSRSAERRCRIAVTGVLAAVAVAAGAVFLAQSGGGGGAQSLQASSGLPPLEVETGVQHVHGLGVGPGDGVLYAATHSGLFRLPEQGQAVRVANRAQESMGSPSSDRARSSARATRTPERTT